jgi:hypothetical protein
MGCCGQWPYRCRHSIRVQQTLVLQASRHVHEHVGRSRHEMLGMQSEKETTGELTEN